MPEAQQLEFSHRELSEILVRHQGITNGHWGIFVKFGLGANNITTGEDIVSPAAILPVLGIGIREFDESNPSTVDASKLDKDTVSD